jgi:hypothetical protein
MSSKLFRRDPSSVLINSRSESTRPHYGHDYRLLLHPFVIVIASSVRQFDEFLGRAAAEG